MFIPADHTNRRFPILNAPPGYGTIRGSGVAMPSLPEYVGTVHIIFGPYRGNPIALYMRKEAGNESDRYRIAPHIYPWNRIVGEGDTANRAAADFEAKWKAGGLSTEMYTGPHWEGGIKPEKPAAAKAGAGAKAQAAAGAKPKAPAKSDESQTTDGDTSSSAASESSPAAESSPASSEEGGESPAKPPKPQGESSGSSPAPEAEQAHTKQPGNSSDESS